MNEAESQKKEVTQGTFSTKKVRNLPDDGIATCREAASANALKVDYGLVVRTAWQNIQQAMRSYLENTELGEKLDTLEKSVRNEGYEEHKNRGLKLNVISVKTFGMTGEGSKMMSIISVAGHQVVKNLSEPSKNHPGTPRYLCRLSEGRRSKVGF